jgi:hypothetical protein
MTKSPKLSKAIRNRIDAFDAAAQSWGWTSDRGTGCIVDDAKEAYERTKKALERSCLQIEKKAAAVKLAKFPELTHKHATKNDHLKLDGRTNMERAEKAKTALAIYGDSGDANCAVIDVLTDLMHMCRVNGMDIDSLLETADRHFTTESNCTEPAEDPYNGSPEEEKTED